MCFPAQATVAHALAHRLSSSTFSCKNCTSLLQSRCPTASLLVLDLGSLTHWKGRRTRMQKSGSVVCASRSRFANCPLQRWACLSGICRMAACTTSTFSSSLGTRPTSAAKVLQVSQAFAEADRPASYSTFWRHWKAKWACCLKFRKVSQHSCCQVCFDFKHAMRSCRGDLGKKLHHASRLREHLRAQYHDRCMYWSLRWASRQRQQVLCIIIDSMDKTKFGVPRYPFSDKPKELDGFVRPKLVCTAALAHGWVTSVFLNDDVVNHGADAFVEVVLQVLEQVSQVSQETGRPMPEHLVIQADNTSSQCKNSLATTFMALMVARYKFVTTNLFFLRVGHTHEDVGSWPNVNVAKNTQHLKG